MDQGEIEARALLEAAGPRSVHDKSYAAACMNKWGKMLNGIQNGYVKKCTAILLENQMEHVKSLQEDTLSTDTGAFHKYTFPILRRVWPNLIANQLVSVQPTTSPVAAMFYYEKKFDDRKGTKIPQGGIANNPTDMSYDGEVNSGDNMIQNFAKYYSSEFNDYDVTCTDTGVGTATLNQGGANCRVTEWSPIRTPATDGQRTFYVKAYYRCLDADNASADTAVVATLNGSGNLIDDLNSNNVGTFTVANGNWAITPLGSAGSASNFTSNTVIYFQYFVNWEQVGYTTGAKIPSISLEITLYTVKVESRKLKARWTVEAVDDMRALHGLDVETEIVSTFSNDVMLEVDREIVTDLVNGAAHTATYTYAATTPGEIETIRALITKVAAMSARIHKTSGRAPANFMVVSPAVQALLDQLSTHGDYASIEQNVQQTSYGPVMANFGISRVGTLLRKWAVYVDPYMDEDKILVGLKGNNFLDAGYVYAPYVPLQVTPTFMEPNDFTFRKGVRTRYATKMLRNEYYGVITCSGLPSVTTTLP
jgi:hypothetical protein